MPMCSQSDVKETCEREITNCLRLTPNEVLSFSKDIQGNAPHIYQGAKELLEGEIAIVFACLRVCFQTRKYEVADKLIMESSGRIRFLMSSVQPSGSGSLETDSIYQVYTVLSTSFELLNGNDGNSYLKCPAGR